MKSKNDSLKLKVSEVINNLKLQFNKDLKVDIEEFLRIAEDTAISSKKKYLKLPEPKTCSEKTYKEYALYEKFTIMLAEKTTIVLSHTDPLYAFLSKISPDRIDEASKKINAIATSNKKDNFLDSQKDFEDFDTLYKNFVVSRNLTAKSNGYSNYLYYILEKQGINQDLFNRFLKRENELISLCQNKVSDIEIDTNKINDNFYTPCFLCDNPKKIFSVDSNVLESVSLKFNILKKYQHKIKIENGDISATRYNSSDDTFTITLNSRFNELHKQLDLIHELSHTISILEDFKNDVIPLSKLRYIREKEGLGIFFTILKSEYKPLYDGFIGNILNDLHSALFEVDAYTNESLNYGLANASIKQKMYPTSNHKNNLCYKLNKNLLFRPLANLIYAIAYSEILLPNQPTHT